MLPASIALLRLVFQRRDDAATTLEEHPPAQAAVGPDPNDRVVPGCGVHDTCTSDAAFGKADPIPRSEPGVPYPVTAPGGSCFAYHWRSPGTGRLYAFMSFLRSRASSASSLRPCPLLPGHAPCVVNQDYRAVMGDCPDRAYSRSMTRPLLPGPRLDTWRFPFILGPVPTRITLCALAEVGSVLAGQENDMEWSRDDPLNPCPGPISTPPVVFMVGERRLRIPAQASFRGWSAL